jgi:hypothetical protein
MGRDHAVGDDAHRADQADPADDDDYGGSHARGQTNALSPEGAADGNCDT